MNLLASVYYPPQRERDDRVVLPRTNQIADEIVHRRRPVFIEGHRAPEMRISLFKPTKALKLRRDIGMRGQIVGVDR